MMTDTPARDALAEALRLKPDGTSIRDIMRHPDLLLAALIESGWQVTDDQLRAMGGKQIGHEIVYLGWAHYRYQKTWQQEHLVFDFGPKGRNDG